MNHKQKELLRYIKFSALRELRPNSMIYALHTRQMTPIKYCSFNHVDKEYLEYAYALSTRIKVRDIFNLAMSNYVNHK